MKSYYRFIKALRAYYQHETHERLDQLFCKGHMRFWRNQYNRYCSGDRSVDVSDATLVAMSP